MSVTSSGSTLCRRLWIKRICHSIVFPQHCRSVSLATKQTHRMSSQINYQPPLSPLPSPSPSPPISPPSFLTTTHMTTNTAVTKSSNKAANTARKLMEKAIVDQAKTSHVDSVHRLLEDLYRSGHTPTIATYNHIIKALAKQFQHKKRQLEAHALLDDMTRRGILPNSQTYIQLLLGYAIHTSSVLVNATATTPNDIQRQKMQLLFDRLLQCEQERDFKRTNQKIEKLVEVMASTGHGAFLSRMMMACVKANVRLDVSIWNTALAGCAKGGYMDAAEQLLEMMRLSRGKQLEIDSGWVVALPDVTSYHTVISGYLRRSGTGIHGGDGMMNIDRAVKLFQMMMDDGLVADYRTYQNFLYAYALPTTLSSNKKKDSGVLQQHQDDTSLDTLQRLWQAMMTTITDGQKLDDGVLTMLLDCYLRHQGYSAMEQVYWDLRQHGYTFSRTTAIGFYKAINGFAQKQHLISGIAMFYDLLAYGHGANHSATSSLLRACVLRGQLDMAQQIVDVIEETLQRPANEAHYALMVRAYVRQGQLELAGNMFNKVLQLTESNNQRCLESLATSYQAMIQGYFKADQQDMAESLLERYINMQKQQQEYYKMDSRLVDVMVEGYGLTGEMGKLDDFLGRKDVDMITNSGTRAILIQSRLQHGHVADAERDLKEGLRYNDIKCLQSSAQAVLSSMALDGNVTTCEYWVDLLSSNHLMTEECYAALLVCYGQAGDMVKLKHTYDDLNKQGIELEDGIRNKIKSLWLEKKCI